MMHFQKIFFCLTFFWLVASCNDDQEKIGWEPEVATPLVLFTVDINKQIDMGALAMHYFDMAGTQMNQNTLLHKILSERDEHGKKVVPADSVKKRLPRYLQSDLDSFCYKMDHQYYTAIPDYTATILVMELFDNFKKNNSTNAINLLTYYIIYYMPNKDVQKAAKDSIYRHSISIYDKIGIDISDLSNRSDNLLWMKLQVAVNTRLKAQARMQVYLHDESGVAFDSLFRKNENGVDEGLMPFAKVGLEDYKQRVIRDYPTHEEAKKSINVHTVSIKIQSDSLCLDTSLVWLKDLTNRKIHTSVGIMLKMNVDDEWKNIVNK